MRFGADTIPTDKWESYKKFSGEWGTKRNFSEEDLISKIEEKCNLAMYLLGGMSNYQADLIRNHAFMYECCRLGENAVSIAAKAILSEYFHLKEQVRGKNLVTGKIVVIDLLAYPKNKAMRLGFEPVVFGIELKSPSVNRNEIKLVKSLFQCLDYMTSVFHTEKDENIYLNSCFLLPAYSHFCDHSKHVDLYNSLYSYGIGQIFLSPKKIQFNFMSRYWDNKRGRASNATALRKVGHR